MQCVSPLISQKKKYCKTQWLQNRVEPLYKGFDNLNNFKDIKRRNFPVISTECFLRRPSTYDDHPIPSHRFGQVLRSKKGSGEGGVVSSKSFDLLNSMIYLFRCSVELMNDQTLVLHSSLDDLVSTEGKIQKK